MIPLAISLLGGLVRHKGVPRRTGLFLLPCTGKTLLLSIELFKIQQLVTTQIPTAHVHQGEFGAGSFVGVREVATFVML